MTLSTLYVCLLLVVLGCYCCYVYDWCVLVDVFWLCILINVFHLMYVGWCILIGVLWSLSSPWWVMLDCILTVYYNWCILVNVFKLMYIVGWVTCFDWCAMIDSCMVSWCMYGCPWLILHDWYMIHIWLRYYELMIHVCMDDVCMRIVVWLILVDV